MNRVEYECALRDLLALPLLPVKEMLPALPASGTANWGTTNGVRDYEGPGVAYDWFEVEGPIMDQWPPEELEAGRGLRPFFCSLARGMAAPACLHRKE